MLDFCIRGTGAQVFAKHGNLMATSAALPYEVSQIKVVPVTSPNIGVYLYGWLPIESQNAWMNGFTSVLQGKVTPKAWAAQVQVGVGTGPGKWESARTKCPASDPALTANLWGMLGLVISRRGA